MNGARGCNNLNACARWAKEHAFEERERDALEGALLG
jgi:hypothetical protein